MALYGILGPIEFEVLTSPEEFRARRAYNYAKHDVVEDRPRLQWIGNDLEELHLRFKFHASFTNPQTQFDLLTATADAHQALPLVFSNGVFRGLYVITEIGEHLISQVDDGSLVAIEVEVELEEYVASALVADTPETPPAVAPTAPGQPGTTALSGIPASVDPTAPLISVSDPTSAYYRPPADACREPSLIGP